MMSVSKKRKPVIDLFIQKDKVALFWFGGHLASYCLDALASEPESVWASRTPYLTQ